MIRRGQDVVFSYFFDKYISLQWGTMLNDFFVVLGFFFLCFDFRTTPDRRVWPDVLRFFVLYAAWILLSSLFYWTFPDSDLGYTFVPLLYAVLYALLDRRLAVWERAVRASIFVTVFVYSAAVTLPLALLQLGGSGYAGTQAACAAVKLILYGGTIFILQKFSLGKFTPSVYFFVLIEAICVIGYGLNTVSAVMSMPQFGDHPFSPNFFSSLSLAVIEIIAYLMFYKLNEEAAKKEALLETEQRMRSELKMLARYEFGYNQVRAVKHDIYNQYSYVNVLLKEKRYDEAMAYFDELRVFVGSMGKMVYTENHIANIALNLAVEQAEQAGIVMDVRAAVPEKLAVDDVALASVLSNLLNNSIEACRRLTGERRVDVALSYDNGHLLIRIVNPVDPTGLVMERGRLTTSKRDCRVHGQGLAIIRRIAEENGGCFRYEIKEGVFIADVMMRCDIIDT